MPIRILIFDESLTVEDLPSLPSPLLTETKMADIPDIKITHLRIRNFRGIQELDIDVPKAGVVFSGTNAVGKTSGLMAIRAVLEAEGIGPDVIRVDTDKAEIRVDMDRLTAKRAITRKGTTSELVGSDGVPLPRAKEQLRQILGEHSLDPLKLFLADAKERRRMILAACPVEITAADLNAWCETNQQWNTEGHGQEVLSRVRQKYFDERTGAGQKADRAKAEAELKRRAADELRVADENIDSPEVARTHVASIERDLSVLAERKRIALEQEQASASTRTRIDELRKRAEGLILAIEAPPTAEMDAANARVDAAVKRLEEANQELMSARKARDSVAQRLQDTVEKQREIDALVGQASDLESSIASMQSDWNPEFHEAVVRDKRSDLEAAAARVLLAEKLAKYRQADAAAKAAEGAQREAERAWEKLDAIVKRLTNEAPADLAKRSNQIPGLEVTPTAVLLDGKNIDLLSGAERMRLAVEVAKRAARKGRILTIDGLEQLAPSNQPEFVRMALEGGWQLFGTRVADGALDIVDCYQLAGKAG